MSPVSASQMDIVRSLKPEIRRLPSCENVTDPISVSPQTPSHEVYGSCIPDVSWLVILAVNDVLAVLRKWTRIDRTGWYPPEVLQQSRRSLHHRCGLHGHPERLGW